VEARPRDGKKEITQRESAGGRGVYFLEEGFQPILYLDRRLENAYSEEKLKEKIENNRGGGENGRELKKTSEYSQNHEHFSPISFIFPGA